MRGPVSFPRLLKEPTSLLCRRYGEEGRERESERNRERERERESERCVSMNVHMYIYASPCSRNKNFFHFNLASYIE